MTDLKSAITAALANDQNESCKKAKDTYKNADGAITALTAAPADEYKGFWVLVIQTASVKGLKELSPKKLGFLQNVAAKDSNEYNKIVQALKTDGTGKNPPPTNEPEDISPSEILDDKLDDLQQQGNSLLKNVNINDYFMQSNLPIGIRAMDDRVHLQKRFREYYDNATGYLRKRENLYLHERLKLIKEYKLLVDQFMKNNVDFENAQKLANEVISGKVKAALETIEKQYPTDFSSIPGFDIFIKNQRVVNKNN